MTKAQKKKLQEEQKRKRDEEEREAKEAQELTQKVAQVQIAETKEKPKQKGLLISSFLIMNPYKHTPVLYFI